METRERETETMTYGKLKTQGVRDEDKALLKAVAGRMEPRCTVPELIHWLLVEECKRRGFGLAALVAEGEALRDDTENDAAGG